MSWTLKSTGGVSLLGHNLVKKGSTDVGQILIWSGRHMGRMQKKSGRYFQPFEHNARMWQTKERYNIDTKGRNRSQRCRLKSMHEGINKKRQRLQRQTEYDEFAKYKHVNYQWVSEWISRFLTAHQHKIVYAVWVSDQCFTSPPTQYRLYGRRFLQVKRSNQQYQSTEGRSTKDKENNENN